MSEAFRGDYFSSAGVNWSTLKNLRESALVYRYRLENGIEDTPALATGRLAHTLVFEPAKFGDEYAIWQDGDRRGNEWKAFKEENAGKTIFKPAEIEQAASIAAAVRKHPLVAPYLDGGAFEQVIRWNDPETGMLCKAKPDWMLPDKRILLDLKTTRSIDARRFGNDVARYSYHCQMAHYYDGIIHALGWKPERVLIVAVEKDAPHDVGVFELSNDDLHVGKDEVRALLNRLQECLASQTWPGKYTEEQVLQLPAYIYGEVEFEYE